MTTYIMPKSIALKIVLLGDGYVGKTSLRRTYLGSGFKSTYSMTIGADFAAKRIKVNNYDILANIWDLAGQNKFKLIRENYYKGASGGLLVFDITRRETFENIEFWIKELINNSKKEILPMILIGNKSDLRATEPNCVSIDEGIQKANDISKKYDKNVIYVESSAKTGDNVESAFNNLMMEIITTRFGS